MKIHLVDATYELFRSYYAVPGRTSDSGREVGAAAGLLRTLLVLLREKNVTHVACAFDHEIESFRNQLLSGYKTAEGVPEDLLSQFEIGEEVSRALGLVTWAMVEFEADDAIATAAARFAEEARVSQVVIASPDKDLAQCVRDERIVCWDRRRRIVLDEDGVKEKFGVAPESIPDYLALVGDAADGLPGISGWGKKSSALVLEQYGHLEAIPDDAGEWEVAPRRAHALAKSLWESKEEALLYRELATLRHDVPLSEELDDLEWKGADRKALTRLAGELGENESLDRVPRFKN